MIIRLIPPDLGACVVRCARLCVEEPLLSDLGHIHVSKLGRTILAQEYIRTFQVSVEYLDLVQCPEPLNDLNKHLPDLVFLDVLLLFLVRSDLLEEVSVVGILHDDAIQKGLI